MQRKIPIALLLIFLVSCASPATQPALPAATQTQTPVPIPTATITATPQPELTYISGTDDPVSAIYDEDTGLPNYVLTNDQWVKVENVGDGSIMRGFTLSGHWLNWNVKAKKWELSINITDEQAEELFGAGNYTFDAETGAVNGSGPRWAMARGGRTHGEWSIADPHPRGRYECR